MNDRENRIRQIEQKLKAPPLEAAKRALARMVEELGPREVLVSGALKALLARYFRANRDTLGDLDSATLLDVLVLVMPLLVMLGVPLPTVQRLSRHKSLAMVLRYAHLCPDHTREALEKLAGFSTNGPNGRPAPEPALKPAPWEGMAKWLALSASPGLL